MYSLGVEQQSLYRCRVVSASVSSIYLAFFSDFDTPAIVLQRTYLIQNRHHIPRTSRYTDSYMHWQEVIITSSVFYDGEII